MSEKSGYLEIACFSPESAIIAAEAGVDRIELCGGPPSSGGLTPSLVDLQHIKRNVQIPVHVMIRPRAGNFVYSNEEINSMKASMLEMKEGADGFVFGVLNDENELDTERCKELLSVANSKPCVFHRAVDEVNDGGQVYAGIKELGFRSVLTSGKRSTAAEGVLILSDVTAQHESSTFNIIVGGGVRASNIEELLERTDARWYHSSALVKDSLIADHDEIKEMLKIIKQAVV